MIKSFHKLHTLSCKGLIHQGYNMFSYGWRTNPPLTLTSNTAENEKVRVQSLFYFLLIHQCNSFESRMLYQLIPSSYTSACTSTLGLHFQGYTLVQHFRVTLFCQTPAQKVQHCTTQIEVLVQEKHAQIVQPFRVILKGVP